jgi:hypothetical protein
MFSTSFPPFPTFKGGEGWKGGGKPSSGAITLRQAQGPTFFMIKYLHPKFILE